MQDKNSSALAQCECGDVKLNVKNNAIMRVICHCTICQEFNDAPFADILIFKKGDVDFFEEHKVNFKTYTSPPLVQRGKCATCHKPAIEFLSIPIMQALTIIPTANIKEQSAIPKPSFHSFYHRRQEDAQDDIPKYNSFVSSQVTFMIRLYGRQLGFYNN